MVKSGVWIYVSKDFKKDRDLAAAKLQVNKVDATDIVGRAFKDESFLSRMMREAEEEGKRRDKGWF